MPGPLRHPAQGFTLVEIVLALGIFSFAIIGIVFLLGTALQSATDTERDSALSAALTTTASLMRSYDNTTPPSVLYFDTQGSPVPTIPDGQGVIIPDPTAYSKAYYRFKITSLNTNGGLPNQEMYSIKATAPYPGNVSVGTFLVSHR